jgi:isopenicillin-N epimerase
MQTNLSSQFLLNPNITFLNFGSFGACVKPVFERYQQYQLELEQEPVQFITVKGLEYLKQSREALANYIGCAADDVVYVTNPSYAVNMIAKSFGLKKDDEILTTDLEYGACDKTWSYYCKKVGAKIIRIPTVFPLTTKEDFVANFFKGLTPKTKMVFINHITSSTGLRLPVEEICAIAKSKGLITFVDGAHAPAQVPLNLQTLQADIYTGACHKWMMTPKGSSFLYVKKEYQSLFDPLVISWGYESAFPSHSPFLDYHQTNGTRDFSAFLTTPIAIQFMQENNWDVVAAQCRALTKANAHNICSILNAQPLAPVNDDFLVQLYSTPIKTAEPEKLKSLLYDKYKIEIPVMRHADKVYLRYSIQAFNTQKDLDILAAALKDIITTTSLIEL